MVAIELPGYDLDGAGELCAGAWRARRRADGRTVLLRWVQRPADPVDPDAARRTLARVGGLAAASLLPLHTVVTTDQGLLIVYDYPAGGSLLTLLAHRRRLTVGETVTLGAELAEALAVVHEAGLSHGNLEESSVYLGIDGTPLLADVGLAAGRPDADVLALAQLCRRVLDSRRRPGLGPAAGLLAALSAIEKRAHVGAAGMAALLRGAAPAVPIRLDGAASAADGGLDLLAPAEAEIPKDAVAVASGVPAGSESDHELDPGEPGELAGSSGGVEDQADGLESAGRSGEVPAAAGGAGGRGRAGGAPAGAGSAGRFDRRPQRRSGHGALAQRLSPAAWARRAGESAAGSRRFRARTGPSAPVRGRLLAASAIVAALLAAVALGVQWAKLGREKTAATLPARPPTQPASSRTASAATEPPAALRSVSPTTRASRPAKVSVPGTSWEAILTGLDQRRAAALATGNPSALAAADAPSSPALRADLRLAGELGKSGVRPRGLRWDILSVAVDSAGPPGVVLRVTDRMMAHDLVRPNGTVVASRPARAPAVWRVTLLPAAAGWRISEIAAA